MDHAGMSYERVLDAVIGHDRSDSDWLRRQLSAAPEGPIVQLGGSLRQAPSSAWLGRGLKVVQNGADVLALRRDPRSDRADVELIARPTFDTGLPAESIAVIFFPANSLGRLHPSAFVLTEAFRLLKPDGKVVIVSDNPQCWRDQHSREWTSVAVNGHTGHCYAETIPVPAAGRGAYETRLYLRNEGADSVHTFGHILPKAEELARLLELTGFRVECIAGDANGADYDPATSRTLYFVASKGQGSRGARFPTTQERYDTIAHDYDGLVSRADYEVPEWLFSRLKARRDAPTYILDLGCGNGNLGRFLRSRGMQGRFFGTDLSEAMVAECNRRRDYAGTWQLDLHEGVPLLESHCFDVILACGVFEFIAEPVPVLKDISRLLRRRTGDALLTFQVHGHGETGVDSAAAQPLTRPKKFSYSSEEICELLSRAGLDVVEAHEGKGYRSPTTGAAVEYAFVRARVAVDFSAEPA